MHRERTPCPHLGKAGTTAWSAPTAPGSPATNAAGERNHHEHVEGDYKSPPTPTNFSRARKRVARHIMKYDPFFITAQDREIVGKLLLESFDHQKVAVACVAVTLNNFHALVRYHGSHPKAMLGYAKAHVVFKFAPIIDATSGQRRPIWETGGLPKPIHDEKHGHDTYQYILEHVKEGAWVWSHRDQLGA